MAPVIRVIGSLNADMVSVTPRMPDGGETITASSFFTSAGGKGANQAVACGRLSRPRSNSTSPSGAVHVEMVGAVGDLDGHFATLLKPTLAKSGVDTARVRTIQDAYTGVAVIIVDTSADGENRILFSPGANYQGMQPTRDVLGMGSAAPVPDVIVMQAEIPVETVVGILREIRAWKTQRRRDEGRCGIEAGPDVMFNPAPAPPGGLPEDVYAAVDHLVMNETEAELMTPSSEQLLKVVPDAARLGGRERVARYFHKLGVTYVLITLGSKGVWFSAADPDTAAGGDDSTRCAVCTNEVPAAKVDKVLDTTAAGDTFMGSYAVDVARWRQRRRADGKAHQDLTADEKTDRYQTFMDQAMRRAVRAAARCVERQGAMDSIPWEDEIDG